jgi:hypothetical protein
VDAPGDYALNDILKPAKPYAFADPGCASALI